MKVSQNIQSSLYSTSLLGFSSLFLINHFNSNFEFYKNAEFLDAFTYSLLLSLFVAAPLGFIVVFQCCLRRKESCSLQMSASSAGLIAYAFFGLMLSLTLCSQMGQFNLLCVALCTITAISSIAACISSVATYFLPHCGSKECKLCN